MDIILLPLSVILAVISALLFVYAAVRLTRFSISNLLFKVIPSFLGSILSLMLAVFCLFSIGYYLLVSSRAIAVVHTMPISEQLSMLRLYTPDGNMSQFNVRGDYWQLDVNVVRVKPLMRLLGVDAFYGFDRLSGRYAQINDEQMQPRTLFDLSAEKYGFDLSKVSENLLPDSIFDASYGSGTYVDLSANNFFLVYLNNEGLYVKTDEVEAKEAIKTWMK